MPGAITATVAQTVRDHTLVWSAFIAGDAAIPQNRSYHMCQGTTHLKHRRPTLLDKQHHGLSRFSLIHFKPY